MRKGIKDGDGVVNVRDRVRESVGWCVGWSVR